MDFSRKGPACISWRCGLATHDMSISVQLVIEGRHIGKTAVSSCQVTGKAADRECGTPTFPSRFQESSSLCERQDHAAGPWHKILCSSARQAYRFFATAQRN